jgi:hypothetical protein
VLSVTENRKPESGSEHAVDEGEVVSHPIWLGGNRWQKTWLRRQRKRIALHYRPVERRKIAVRLS